MKKISKVLAVMLTIGVLMNIVPIVAEASVFLTHGRVYNFSVDTRNDHLVMGTYRTPGSIVGVDATACEFTKANTVHSLWAAYCLPNGSGFKPSYTNVYGFTTTVPSRYYQFTLGINIMRDFQIWLSTNSDKVGSSSYTMSVHATVWSLQNVGVR